MDGKWEDLGIPLEVGAGRVSKSAPAPLLPALEGLHPQHAQCAV